MAQVIDAKPFQGAAIRVACELSCGNLDGAATMWLRLDGANGRHLRFENLLDRPGIALKGSEDWKGFAITLDVPEAAESVFFGFLVSGRGTGWARSFSVDRVEAKAVPEGRKPYRFDRPTNLGFGA